MTDKIPKEKITTGRAEQHDQTRNPEKRHELVEQTVADILEFLTSHGVQVSDRDLNTFEGWLWNGSSSSVSGECQWTPLHPLFRRIYFNAPTVFWKDGEDSEELERLHQRGIIKFMGYDRDPESEERARQWTEQLNRLIDEHTDGQWFSDPDA